MSIRNVLPAIFLLLGSYPVSFAQITNPSAKKFNVYKIDINPNATKDGIRGVSVLFSCEYHFADPEYASMKDGRGRTYFTFYATLTDAAKEPAYYPFNYTFYRKLNETTALHFAYEHAYEPQNKAQGRRNTGVELFIPFTHTTLPEGTNPVTFSLNAVAEKGKRFDNIYSQALTVNRPPAYAARLVPKKITVTDKAGKRYEAGRLEQDFFVYPGSNKTAKDVSAAANVDLAEGLGFTYSEGDVIRLKVGKSTQTGLVRTNKPRLLRTTDEKSLGNFDNAAALTGEWPLDPKAGKLVSVKNNALDLQLELTQYRIPAVRLTGVSVNPFATHEGVAGATVTFTPTANLTGNTPPLEAWVAYLSDGAEEPVYVRGGKVIAGNAKSDTTGAVVLDRTSPGKVTVFYPTFNLLLTDPAIRQSAGKRFNVQIRLPDNPGAIAQKEIKQDLPLNAIKDVSLATASRLKDTIVNNEHGMAVSVTYQLPKLYFELHNGQRYVTFYANGQENRGVELLRRLIPLDASTKRINATDKKAAHFALTGPKEAIRLFIPYTSLNKIETTPLPVTYRAYVANGTGSPVGVGEGNAAIRFETDRQKLRFVSVGIASIKLKKAESGQIAWRIRSANRVLYQSNPIPAAKAIDNLYTDAFYIHEEDKLVVEVLKGATADALKAVVAWESPVKGLKASEQIEIDPAKQANNPDDGDTRSVTVSYTAQ